MMSDPGIHMAFANSPQAKGRVERHDHAARNRLPNDATRFGIRDHGTPDHWPDDLCMPHVNGKLSFEPAERESPSAPLGPLAEPLAGPRDEGC